MAYKENNQGEDKSLRKFLKSVSFPAEKQEVVDAAKHSNAPDEVLQGLNGLSSRVYNDVQDVADSMLM